MHGYTYLAKTPCCSRCTQRRGANILLVQFRAALHSYIITFLPLANSASHGCRRRERGDQHPGDTGTAGDTDAYLAQLRTALPQSWLQREFQRQRSFPAFAHSRQLVAKGQYEEAFRELERYLASDPDDLSSNLDILFSQATLSVIMPQSVRPTGSSLPCPTSHLHYFYRGLAQGGLGREQRSFAGSCRRRGQQCAERLPIANMRGVR